MHLALCADMTHMILNSYMTRRLPAITAAVVLIAVSSIACSGSPLATAPFAPSAVPAMTLSAESGDASDTWGALDKGKDKGKGGKGDTTTDDDTGTDGGTGTGDNSGTGDDSGKGKDKGKGKGKDGTTPDEDEDDAGEDDDADEDGKDKDGKGKDGGKDGDKDGDEAEDDDEAGDGRNPHRGAGPHSGIVSSFRGTCPAVTFNLKGTRISTTAATTYVGGTCEILRPNVHVVVTGAAGTESRTFVAATVTIVRTH